MKAKLISDGSEKTWALILAHGDEAAACILQFAKEQGLKGSHFTAIGGFEHAVLGYYSWELKKYEKIPVREQVEVLSLVGDIAVENGEPKVHAHVVVGCRDGSARGGHLMEGYVRPTLEVMITEAPEHLQKKFDVESQLALIAP